MGSPECWRQSRLGWVISPSCPPCRCQVWLRKPRAWLWMNSLNGRHIDCWCQFLQKGAINFWVWTCSKHWALHPWHVTWASVISNCEFPLGTWHHGKLHWNMLHLFLSYEDTLFLIRFLSPCLTSLVYAHCVCVCVCLWIFWSLMFVKIAKLFLGGSLTSKIWKFVPLYYRLAMCMDFWELCEQKQSLPAFWAGSTTVQSIMFYPWNYLFSSSRRPTCMASTHQISGELEKL